MPLTALGSSDPWLADRLEPPPLANGPIGEPQPWRPETVALEQRLAAIEASLRALLPELLA